MKLQTKLIGGLAAMALLAGCVNPTEFEDPNARTKGGALAGAVVGGVLGANSGSNQLARGLAGAAVGAALGGAIGSSLDAQAAELRRQMGSSATVQNNGNSLTVTMAQDVLFATNSYTVLPAQQQNLFSLAQNLQRYPNSRVEVIGHTDSTGDASFNQSLSERRAGAVRDVISAGGVHPNRLSAFGRGESQPIATNMTPEGRAQNRRVEIIIVPMQ
jgi:outer membrane protein OmpA-like peptidoglycan-associated protein